MILCMILAQLLYLFLRQVGKIKINLIEVVKDMLVPYRKSLNSLIHSLFLKHTVD